MNKTNVQNKQDCRARGNGALGINTQKELARKLGITGARDIAVCLEQASIHVLTHVEINLTCCETLKQNRPQWNVINADVKDVDFSQHIGKIDIVADSFPCQAVSYAGKKLVFEDTHGTLFYEFASCVKEAHPKMFWAENVCGLLSHDDDWTFRGGVGAKYKQIDNAVPVELAHRVDVQLRKYVEKDDSE